MRPAFKEFQSFFLFSGFEARNLQHANLYEEDLSMEVLSMLINGMLHSSIAGTVGVMGILTYLAVIVIAAIYRIREGMKEAEHH